jgi:hypothetical protein
MGQVSTGARVSFAAAATRLALAPEFAALVVVTHLPGTLREGQAARAE